MHIHTHVMVNVLFFTLGVDKFLCDNLEEKLLIFIKVLILKSSENNKKHILYLPNMYSRKDSFLHAFTLQKFREYFSSSLGHL